jgi:NAD(P)-dependent dehydrogenase (short-subunit alcohol dehydrogenase family)
LRTLDGCQHVFDSVKDRFDRCDILVCSAGATRAGNFTELPDQAWIDGYALKFFGCVRMCRLFWPMLNAARVGSSILAAALPAPLALTSQSVTRGHFGPGVVSLLRESAPHSGYRDRGRWGFDRRVLLSENHKTIERTNPG